jgi:hypothetical protein
MDLRNLLNQGDDNLSISELKQLVAAKDTEATVKRITQCTFTFPTSRDESFEFFDLFIQLLLSVAHQEDPYGFQYSKSIVINSLRSCISGLVQQFGLIWLIEFPKRFSAYTWLALNSNTDSSILIYLYGLVLASYNKPDVPQDVWIEGYSRFVQSDRSMILLHMWLQFCLMDDQTNEADLKYIYLDHLDHRLKQRVPAQKAISEAFSVMKEMNVDLLSSTIDEQLGNALARSRFTKDELTLGLMEMGNCLSSNYHKQKYSCLFKLYCNFKHSTVKSKSKFYFLFIYYSLITRLLECRIKPTY